MYPAMFPHLPEHLANRYVILYACVTMVLDSNGPIIQFKSMSLKQKQTTYSTTRLTVATQQTFLQVSQSGYTNVIDGHASLQNWCVKIILSSERFGLGR